MIVKKKLAVAISLTMIAACSNEPSKEQVELEKLRMEQARLQQMVEQQFDLDRSYMSESDDIYVIGKAFDIKEEQPLPPIFDIKTDIGSLENSPLERVIDTINRKFQKYGVVIAVERDAENYLANKQKDETGEEETSSADDVTGGVLPIMKIDSSALIPSTKSKYGTFLTMNFKDSSLRQMLDLISASTGLWWAYEDGRVTLNYFQKETFPIDVTDSAYKIASSQSSQASSDTGSADFSLSTSSEETQPLTEIETQLQQYLSIDGSLALNRFDRTVTIKDTPSNIKRAKAFIDDFNYRALTPYNLKADVYEVIYEKNTNNRLDWTVAFESANWGLKALAPKVISETGMGELTANKIGGKFDGTKAFINFLDKNASVYSRITNTVKTKNNIPTQLVSANNQAIVSGREITIDSNGFAQSNTNTKIINAGFNISMRPRLTSTGSIDLELIMNTKAITDVKTFGTDDDMVQLEETGQHGTISGIPIRSGESVILNAYEKDLSSADIASLHERLPWWTGGGKGSKRYAAAMIVMVRADIMER